MKKIIEDILACPTCKSPLRIEATKISCQKCNKIYARDSDGTPLMILNHQLPLIQKGSLKKKSHHWVSRLVPPSRVPGVNIGFRQEDFVRFIYTKNPDAVVLNVGSGDMTLDPRIINLDIFNNPHVDIVADGHRLPLIDECLDGIIVESVIEHVANPWEMVTVFYRVLKPGGHIYVVAPFVFPYHEAPIDCWRFTETGLCILMNQFERIDSGYLKGPVSAYARVSADFLGVILSFNIPSLEKTIKHLARLILHPFTYLDYVVKRYGDAGSVASGTYFLGKKPKKQ